MISANESLERKLATAQARLQEQQAHDGSILNQLEEEKRTLKK